LELRDEELFFDANAIPEDGDAHSPQSSSTCGASPTAIGAALNTSSSTPQSGHCAISPRTISFTNGTWPPHSMHSVVDIGFVPPENEKERARRIDPASPLVRRVSTNDYGVERPTGPKSRIDFTPFFVSTMVMSFLENETS